MSTRLWHTSSFACHRSLVLLDIAFHVLNWIIVSYFHFMYNFKLLSADTRFTWKANALELTFQNYSFTKQNAKIILINCSPFWINTPKIIVVIESTRSIRRRPICYVYLLHFFFPNVNVQNRHTYLLYAISVYTILRLGSCTETNDDTYLFWCLSFRVTTTRRSTPQWRTVNLFCLYIRSGSCKPQICETLVLFLIQRAFIDIYCTYVYMCIYIYTANSVARDANYHPRMQSCVLKAIFLIKCFVPKRWSRFSNLYVSPRLQRFIL